MVGAEAACMAAARGQSFFALSGFALSALSRFLPLSPYDSILCRQFVLEPAPVKAFRRGYR
jgi:hypothetical protein